MSDISKINFDVDTSDASVTISVTVLLDSICVFQTDHLVTLTPVDFTVLDDDGDHELCIVIAGKNSAHTQVDSQGNIIKDVVVNITNVTVDGIDISHLFNEKCVYTHDFNGTTPEIAEKFYGTAGCNGTISFKFSTPLYLWLLENM